MYSYPSYPDSGRQSRHTQFQGGVRVDAKLYSIVVDDNVSREMDCICVCWASLEAFAETCSYLTWIPLQLKPDLVPLKRKQIITDVL